MAYSKWGVLLKWLRVVSGLPLYFALFYPEWPEMEDNWVHSVESESPALPKIRFLGIFPQEPETGKNNQQYNSFVNGDVNRLFPCECKWKKKGWKEFWYSGEIILSYILNECPIHMSYLRYEKKELFQSSFWNNSVHKREHGLEKEALNR